MRSIRAAFLIGLLASPAGLAAQDEAPIGIESIVDLDRRIGDVLVETRTPGMIGAIVTRDRVIWAGGVGLANRATMEPADGDTIFRLGSITKSLTSLAVLILVERGQLSLDQEVRDLLSDLDIVNPWADTAPVRLVHLLEHTSGFDEVYRGMRGKEEGVLPLRDAIRLNSRSLVARWPPGTHVSYSNVGPAVAAWIIEEVTGRMYEDFVEEEVFDPVGMSSAALFFHEGIAPGYVGPDQREHDSLLMPVRPSGGLSASANDMARLVRMLLNRGEIDGRRILEPSSIERMETPTTGWAAARGIRMGRGPGLNSQYIDGFRFKGHGGTMPGFFADYRYLPQHGVGYFFGVNGFNPESRSRLRALFREVVTAHLEPDAPPPVVPLSDEEIRSYRGYYEPYTTRFGLLRFADRILGIDVVTAIGDRITVGPSGSPALELFPLGQGQFRRALDPDPVLVFRRDGGELYLISPEGTYRKISALSAWGRRGVAALIVVVMISAPAFALVWIPRRIYGSLSRADVAPRWLPLAAVLCLLAAAGTFAWTVGAGQPDLFGRLTIWAVSFTSFTWLFAVLALVGAWRVWATRAGAVRRSAWIHAAAVSLANVTALAYLAYWDIIGLRLWP